MKPKSILILLAFFIITNKIIAQNTFTIESKEVGTETSFDVAFSLANSAQISAIQFDIALDKDAFELMTGHYLTSRGTNHTLGVSSPSEGVVRVVIYSATNADLADSTGDFLILKLKSKTLPGDFILNYSEIIVSSSAGLPIASVTESSSIKVLGPLMNIVTTSVDFGRAPIGDSPTKTVTVQNVGNLPLILSSASTITPFSIQESFPFTINANTSENLTLLVDSSTKYNSSVTLSFGNNDADPLRKIKSVALTAEIYAVNEIKIGSGSGEIHTEIEIPVVIDNMEPFTGFQFDVLLPVGIEYVPSSIVTSDRFDGHSIGVSLISGNKLRFIAYSGANKDFIGNTGELFNFKLKPSVSSGNYSLVISDAIISNVSLGDIISDSYNGSIQINSPSLSLSPSSISYENVPITETRQTSVRLTNTGTALLVIDQLTYNNEALDVDITLPLEIGAGSFSDVNILFTPKNIGTYSESISFRHNGSSGQELLQVDATVFSPNFVMIESKEAYRNETNTFQVLLKNNDAVRAVQFDLELPTGFLMDINTLGTTNRTTGHTVSSSKLNATTYRIIVYATTNISIDPGDQSILTLPIHLESSISLGDYSFIFSDTIISDVNNQDISSIVLENGVITVALKDSDNDGITDTLDTCPDTPTGETVNDTGCSTSQIDTDGDDVMDDVDACPDTPAGETVNATGCSTSQIDTDGDGVMDDVDTCPDTLAGETVNDTGCADSQLSIEDEVFAESISLFPNPVLNILSIKSEVSPVLKVNFYSILGKKVKEIKSNFNSIITNDLSRGIYILQIYSDKGMTTKKLIKN